jgi:hypothetical protein
LEEFINYTFEMGSGAVIYIPIFINWFRYSKIDGVGLKDTQTA